MITKTICAAVNGLQAQPVNIEINMTNGVNFFIVGLPDNAVRESRLRIFPAITNSGFTYPKKNITANLAPADLRKEGSGYDLPLAIGMLAGFKLVNSDKLSTFMLVGELGLDGSLRPIRGALPVAILARKMGLEGLIVPYENVREAAVVNKLEVYGAKHLNEVVEILNGTSSVVPTIVDTRKEFYEQQTQYSIDFSDVRGQEVEKRAFEIAAAGGHNLLLVGSPGCGKSMMAKRLPTILPPLTLAESLETTQIHSVAGMLEKDSSLVARRPFRSPHHTISDVALIGGGTNFQPGEISLAHNGVLFLDELPEFSRSALETLRQPIEDRMVSISRAKYNIELPCSFQLIASMNPCPCGYYHHPTRACVCSSGQIQRYLNKISGPMLDRFDIQLEVAPVSFEQLAAQPTGDTSAQIRERVVKARQMQEARFKDLAGVHCNAQMSVEQADKLAKVEPQAYQILRDAMEKFNLSARAYVRVLKVARTIADLEGTESVLVKHIGEAVYLRRLDRGNWGE